MIDISAPGLLFRNQKLFQLHRVVEKHTAATQSYKLIIIYDFSQEELPLPLKEMIDKLVQACKFSLEDTLYINANFSKDVSLAGIQNQFSPQAVLVFGKLNLSRNLPIFQKNSYFRINDTNILFAEELEILGKNPPEKAALWNALKKMLNIK